MAQLNRLSGNFCQLLLRNSNAANIRHNQTSLGHANHLSKCLLSIKSSNFKMIRRMSTSSSSGPSSQSSSSASSTAVTRPIEPDEDIPEEEFVVSGFHHTELIPEVPIKNLLIESKINKVKKRGSFSVDLFMGRYDHDFLIYPEPLETRVENLELKEQRKMVEQIWPQIWDDHLQLERFNFFSLYRLSATEMMTIFEAIGASSRTCYESKIPVAPNSSTPQPAIVSRAIISLIIRSCLTYRPMYKSDNQKVKEILSTHEPIGFCWTENAPELGSVPPQEWQTFGLHGGANSDHYLIKGRKTKVLHEDSINWYMVYFRDQLLCKSHEEKTPDDEPNPASDPFVGSCLIHKSEIKQGPTYEDSAGYKYTDIEFDTTVPDERQVFPAKRLDPTAVNIKALGQVASCSVTLGILKDALKRTYKHLLDNKRGLLSCDIIERKLVAVTGKIFAIESVVYYIAGMYDGLEEGFDAHMEAIILKIITNEYAFEIIQDLQLICGSEMFIISKLQDQINIFDAFLDGNIYNRLYLATMGVIWFARSKNKHLNQLRLAPWYPGYFMKNMLKEQAEAHDYLLVKADVYGNLHPSLKEAATNLQYILARVKYATESLCIRHGKDVTGAQTALYRLSQISIDSFLLTTLCARASKSYCNGSRNSEIDVAMATQFSNDLARRVRNYMEDLRTTVMVPLDTRARTINELNLKMGGYYAESPLDPNI